MPSQYDPVLDELIWNARAIGEAANIRNADGSVNDKKANRLLVDGVLPGMKRGGRWVSTRRLLLRIAVPTE
jgi:hypothetical protein